MTLKLADEWEDYCAYAEDGFPNEEIAEAWGDTDMTQFCQWAIVGWNAADFESVKIFLLERNLYIDGLLNDLELYRQQDPE